MLLVADGEGLMKALAKHRAEIDEVDKEFNTELVRVGKIPGAQDAMAESMVGLAGIWLTGSGTNP